MSCIRNLMFAATAGLVAAACDPPPTSAIDPERLGGTITPPGCDFDVRIGVGASAPRFADDDVGDDPTPRQIRLGAGADPRRNVAVTWRTVDNATTAGLVRFGKDDLDQVAPSLTWDYTSGEVVRVHEAHLCGLEPDTVYRYRVENGDAVSEELSFRTAPDFAADPTAEVVLAVLGDARGHPEVLADVLTMLDELAAPDYVVFSGDWIYQGSPQDRWDPIFDELAPVFSRAPIISAVGNHDRGNIAFFSQLALPGDERFFSVDLGPAHIVVVDDSTTLVADHSGAGKEFLAADLAVVRPEPWTFVVHHQPLYSAASYNGHGSTDRLRTEWEDVLVDGGVDMVVAGHDHKYERTAAQRGITYVVSGGAGAPLYEANEAEWTAHTASEHHGLIVRVSADSVDVTAYTRGAMELDSFRLTAE